MERIMLKTVVLPFIRSYLPNALRHGAQAAAGALVTQGFLSADQGTALAGALLAVATIAWSVAEKHGLLDKLVS
jgi:hypothetical protein